MRRSGRSRFTCVRRVVCIRSLDKDLVHHVGPGGDDRAQLVAVDGLGRPGAGMPGQAGDLLDGSRIH